MQADDPSLGAADYERWKNLSLKFEPGDLVKITSQPYFEDRGLIGKIGIVIKKTVGVSYINHLYWEVLVDGEMHSIHYRNIVKLGENKNE